MEIHVLVEQNGRNRKVSIVHYNYIGTTMLTRLTDIILNRPLSFQSYQKYMYMNNTLL